MNASRRAWLFARALASAFLAGDWEEDGLVERGREVVGRRPKWLRRLAQKVLAHHPDAPHHARDDLARVVFEDRSKKPPLHVRRWFFDEPEMRSTQWSLPPLRASGEIARWLGLEVGKLDGLADRKGLERVVVHEPLRNYRYVWIPKRAGGLRLIEQPKPRLRAIQRRVLHEILDHVSPHDTAHAFREARSVVTCAMRHTGRAVVIRIDLEDFFASIRGGRVVAIFRALGYPDEAARTLAALCTNRVPPPVLEIARADARRRAELALPEARAAIIEREARASHHLAHRHLPQGAPTSPALANLAAFTLDVRLSSLAFSLGANYTRYADDLVFSGDEAFARRADRFHALVTAIALEEGFTVNTRKTRVMRRGVRQRVTSIVVNDHPNVDRPTFDRLKAILTNCVRHGPASQNRAGVADFRAHLAGKIAWVKMVAPTRAEKLEKLFAAIAW